MNKVYVVGLGPGGEEFMTAQARAAMERADVLCGYTVYVDLVKHLYPGKETYVTPMTRELERCRWALETAAAGRTVAMVCSGDAGVYGMAGPLLQLAGEYGGAEVEVVPGVTSALSGAAVLGAPLMHDFCVICSRRGSRSNVGWPLRRRGIFPYACTTRPRKSGRTICAAPAISCCGKKARTPSAAGCATSAGRASSTAC